MMRISLFLLSLSLLFISIDAAFPTVDFTGMLQKYATTTDGTWCSKCQAFSNPNNPCAMGCAGDPGGGPCPPTACPRVYSFPIVNSQPIWNIQVATVGDPYRAFSYIPLCTEAGQCTESFFFSFSFKYTPGPNAAQTNFFSATRDYLKLLFWGDGNNILGVKNGQLIGLPNAGAGFGDLVGQNNIGIGHAFAIPFNKDTWYHIGVQLNVNGGRTSVAFFINGVATGSTTGSIGIQNSGLQFGAYVWNGAFFTLQFKDIAITKNLPNIATGTTTTAPPVTAKPTTAPTAKVTSAPTATAKPTAPTKSTTTIPPTDPTPPIDDTVTPPPSVVTDPPLDDTTDPPSSTDPPPAVTTRQPTSGPNMPSYALATVALHNKATDCWTILDGIVYDISKLVLIHPGGPAIRSYCGIDCSTIFSASHQNDAADRALLAKSYLKGTLGSTTTSKPTNPGVISIVSRSNHATTITADAACFFTSLIVAAVLEYLL